MTKKFLSRGKFFHGKIPFVTFLRGEKFGFFPALVENSYVNRKGEKRPVIPLVEKPVENVEKSR